VVDDDAAPTFVRLWDIGALDDLRHHAVERACTLTGGGLDPGEWARFVPDLPHRDSCPT
jgi:hypothetical protein